MDIQTLEFTLSRLADAGVFGVQQAEALKLARDLVAVVRQRAELEGNTDATMLLQRAAKARVLATVDGGVASYICDPVVEVEIFDWDNYRIDPSGTPKPAMCFADLANTVGVPVCEA